MPAIGNIDEIMEAVGVSAFRALVSARGGRRIAVPKQPDDALIQFMGGEGARRLCDAFGGFAIDVPNLRPTTLPSRREAVLSLVRAGLKDCEIADALQITERAVRGYRAAVVEALPGGTKVPVA